MKRSIKTIMLLLVWALICPSIQADPCGMVPPIYTGNQTPIARVGMQKTYVFFKDGVETFVIRPGYSGKIDDFGMLIPFPKAPELRKVSDNVFPQIANAIDPPEVVIDLRPRPKALFARGGALPMSGIENNLKFKRDTVTVLKQEAVGMYEVAVLETGSAAALKKWMDQHGYQYPKGMEDVTEDYVELGWCFVAVKTKVGNKGAVDPQPGQRKISPELPAGSVFDGNVQAMGFRFKTDELVVPMRLAAFNEGETHNVVYLLTDGPRRIRSIPEEYVMRQISGQDLYDNVTLPLPLRIIGGTEKDVQEYQRLNLSARRNPEPKNGVAKDLFAADLLAVSTGELSLRHEEEEKELLRIGEHFGLRGAEIDAANLKALAKARKVTTEKGLEMLKGMTMTIVDGDFPREVIARENLTFVQFDMPNAENNPRSYDATLFGPAPKKEGILKVGAIDWSQYPAGTELRVAQGESQHTSIGQPKMASDENGSTAGWFRSNVLKGLAASVMLLIGVVVVCSLRSSRMVIALLAMAGTMTFVAAGWAEEPTSVGGIAQDSRWAELENSKTAKAAIESIAEKAKSDSEYRKETINQLLKIIDKDQSLAKRGWAIAALAAIGGQDIDEHLLNIHANSKQEQVVRTWSAAARVSMTKSVNGLIEKANLISSFPALGRPIGMRIVEKMNAGEESSPEKVLAVIQQVPQLQSALAPTILAFGAEKLADVMLTAADNQTRRMAAGYLGAMTNQGQTPDIISALTDQLSFEPEAQQVPWDGGALFLPGIAWNKKDARAVVGQLIRWNLWCDVQGKSQEQQQIHNNIRSLGLANAAGYQSPGWQVEGCKAWLEAWKKAAGKEEVRTILKQQDLVDSPKYADVLK